MTAEYWVVDPASGDHSKVAGATDRDDLLRQGWTTTDEPADDAMVTIWREGLAEPGRVPFATLRALWSHKGFVAGPPPGSAHPAAQKPVAEPATTKPSKSASGGEVKETSGA